MIPYSQMPAAQLEELLNNLNKEYTAQSAKGLKLNLSRGKPDHQQLLLSSKLFDCIDSTSTTLDENGDECANYGTPEGIPEARRLMAEILDAKPEEVLIGGNSSLNLMHDVFSFAWVHGLPQSPRPWGKEDKVKFLCPSPGYDRHFSVSEHFGAEMITVPMTSEGPDMDVIDALVKDPTVKGMWCVPKYSNPTGITFSDNVIRRMANLKAAAPDFCIFYDNAYVEHHLYPDSPDLLLPILDEAKKAGHPNIVFQFISTSKMTFPGAGISAVNASSEIIAYLAGHISLQTIGFDKLNQLRHVRFFENLAGVKAHMRKHAELLLPKFNAVQDILKSELEESGTSRWFEPKGGYFISLDVPNGCAKRVVSLCKDAGVALTPAGATYPKGIDPNDANIRIAPTFATLDQLKSAAMLLCLCVKIASIEKLLKIK